ncbi:hypothetical protein [Lapillicoccus jejuensis]|uniref:Uncharacterized protein n=1 Tax=Lapillicoccus jejuensis TaxID=402171 RepID=A0A542DVK8_9MICO|nr:hypothetical protein [Lapillicoccus jejuensis]TQJ07096.1 hypothetical protein FB458_0143 [Lapillicoccus jejuensis]
MSRRRPPRRALAGLAAALLLGVAGPAALPTTGAVAATADPVPTTGSVAGAFYPVPTTALLGTAARPAVLGAASTTTVGVTGRDGLPPAGVSAVVVNVTLEATSGRAALLALRPQAGPLATGSPLTSVTALPGRPTTTLATVPLDPDGGFSAVASAPARVHVDLVGLYAADDTVVAALGASGGYQPMSAVRVVGPGAGAAAPDSSDASDASDTSDATDAGGAGDGPGGTDATTTPSPQPTVDTGLARPLAGGERRAVALDLGAATAPHVTALLLRVTALVVPSAGTVTLAADPGAGEPTQVAPATGVAASSAAPSPTLTLTAGATASNLAVVPAVVDGDGLLRLVLASTLTDRADVRVDLVGFYDDGGLGPDLRFRSLPVGRVVDTRVGLGASGPLTAATTLTPDTSVVGGDTFALVGTLTTLGARSAAGTAAGQVRAVPSDELGPAAAPAGPAPGGVPVPVGSQQSTPVQPEVGTDGSLALAAGGAGPRMQAVLDVVGSFEAYPEVADPSARGWVDAVPGWQVRALAR